MMTSISSLAIVTGGCSGLGHASATALINAGWQVCIFDVNKDSGDKVASQLSNLNCHYEYADVTSSESVERAFERVQLKFQQSRVRLLVNCAGVAPAKRTLNRDGQPMPLGDFTNAIQINLIGSFNVARIAASIMAKNSPSDQDSSRGVIINTASVAGYDGQIGQTAYASSKAGIIGLTLPMARDLASVGIRVNTIAPGIMGTRMLLAMPENVKVALVSNVQHPKRLGLPEEFAKLILHIVDNKYINGETIRLDGGLRMPPK
jgi:NAD(P)-dependent dehydrogenase (short-subunit alcohol dehydrogenase family)